MAEVLKFNDGFKEFAVNGDESRIVRFNPCDFAIVERTNASAKRLEKIEAKYKKAEDENTVDFEKISAECDSEIRSEINAVFGNDVCTPAFGDTNCLSLAGGSPIFDNFLNAMLDIVKKEIDKETSKSKKRIAVYTNQVKK